MILSADFWEESQQKYQIVYADPGWEYRDKAGAGKRGVAFKYTVNSLDLICQLPVSSITAEDCVLFLWVPMPHLSTCWKVIESWGFVYKTAAFIWVKRNKKKPTWFWGMGHWTRSNAELCLLAVKGKPKRISGGVHSIVDTPRRIHSKKPDEVRDRIVELMGDLPRIELYARDSVLGWDSWGDEVV